MGQIEELLYDQKKIDYIQKENKIVEYRKKNKHDQDLTVKITFNIKKPASADGLG